MSELWVAFWILLYSPFLLDLIPFLDGMGLGDDWMDTLKRDVVEVEWRVAEAGGLALCISYSWCGYLTGRLAVLGESGEVKYNVHFLFHSVDCPFSLGEDIVTLQFYHSFKGL